MPRNHAPETVGSVLREARAAAGLTIRDLAERSGVHEVSISRLESGAKTVTADTLVRLAGGLGVSIGVLDRCKPLPDGDLRPNRKKAT